MTRLVFRPLDHWSTALTADRRESPFTAGWGDTAMLLRREVDMIAPRMVDTLIVVQLDVAESAIRQDGLLVGRTVVESPRVAVSFDSRYGPLRYECDTYTVRSHTRSSWQHNARAIAKGLEALRAIDRWGIAGRGEQYTGFGQLGSGIPMGEASMTVDEAERLLRTEWHGAASEARDWATLYRRAAKKHHPDAGGDATMFRRLTEARDLLIGAST